MYANDCNENITEFLNKITLGDCLDVMKQLPDGCVDLVVTDPPYLYKHTQAGSNSNFSKSIQKAMDDISEIKDGVSLDFCSEILRIQKKVNAYIWCSKDQIIDYLNFFVVQNKCSYDILCWYKSNAMPTFNNKYLTDKEYCLYFRKGGYCMPKSYDEAKTIFHEPINILDKTKWGHPTIKPLKIFETLIKNSSNEGDLVLDCFGGSGTTAVAAYNLKRDFIVIEKSEEYFKKSCERLAIERSQLRLF